MPDLLNLTHTTLVFGHNRIPIVSWLREQAAESLTHAQQAGEMITLLGEYPSLAIGPLLDTHRTDVGGRSSWRSMPARWSTPRSFTRAKSTRCCASLAKSPLSVRPDSPDRTRYRQSVLPENDRAIR